METAAVVLPVFEPTDIITPDELCARLKVGRTWFMKDAPAPPRQASDPGYKT